MTDVRSQAIDPARTLDRAIEALNRRHPILPLEEVDRALAQAPHDYRLWHVKASSIASRSSASLPSPR